MKKLKFFSLNIARVQNDDAANLFEWTLNVGEPVKSKVPELVKLALDSMETKSRPFITQINRLRESPYTPLINAGRIQNNSLMSEVKRAVTFEMKSRIAERKAAAVDLNYFYKPYWDLSERPLGNQIKDTSEMIEKYEADATIVAKGTLLGLNTPMGELKTNNTSLSSNYLARLVATGERRGSSGTDLRPAASESYISCCSVIEETVNLMPTEETLELFTNMNELRIKTHALISKSKDKPDEEEKKD